MSDLISRDDAVALVIKAIHGTDNKEIQEYLFDGLRKQMWSLPSAKPTGDLISIQMAIEHWGRSSGNLTNDQIAELQREIESLPSAEAEDRLYIKIYADDEPSVMAEKLYQICDETQNGEVAEWLKEYFPSADRPTGWIPFKKRPLTDEEKEEYPDWIYIFDCPLPDDEEEILLSNGKHVWTDTFIDDGECYLDGGDDIDEGMAWMPMPEPYKGGEA